MEVSKKKGEKRKTQKKVEPVFKKPQPRKKYKGGLMPTVNSNNVILTPEWLKDFIQKEFDVKFTFDPAPVDQMIDGKIVDCLDKDFEWGEVNFVNPPYNSEPKKNNGIKGFLQKALQEKLKGKSSYFLFPYRPTKYHFELVLPNVKSIIILEQGLVRFLKRDGIPYPGCFPHTLCVLQFDGSDKTVTMETKPEIERPVFLQVKQIPDQKNNKKFIKWNFK
jgi:hypothetical protein